MSNAFNPARGTFGSDAKLRFPPASAKVGKSYAIADHYEVEPRIACRELIPILCTDRISPTG